MKKTKEPNKSPELGEEIHSFCSLKKPVNTRDVRLICSRTNASQVLPS